MIKLSAKITDDVFIHRVRQNQRLRRKLGLLQLIVGLLLGSVMAFLAYDAYSKFSQFPLAADATPAQMKEMENNSRFLLGFLLGSTMAGALSFAIGMTIQGLIRLFIADRKDRLLLQCWDESRRSGSAGHSRPAEPELID